MSQVAALYAASTATQAIGNFSSAYSESEAIKMQGKYSSSQLEFNAKLAELQAKDALRRGDKEAIIKRQQVRQAIASQRVNLAAQGVDVNQDTAAIIQEDTSNIGAEDVATIKNNAWREAWGYRVQATDYRSQSKFTALSARNRSRQTLLTGGMKAAQDITSGMSNYQMYGKDLKKGYGK